MPQDVFQKQLQHYRQQIDEEIARALKADTASFGVYADEVAAEYWRLVTRGGKRIRGVLTMVGYELLGGENTELIVQAARAVEMLQAYILIIDDIQDRSPLRRGEPSAHIALQSYAEQNALRGDTQHLGLSLALDASLYGLHQMELAFTNLPVSAEARLSALRILNTEMTTTIHGQTWDIVNEARDDVSIDDVEQVMEWKTAHYSFINPLQIGIALAGGTEEQLEAVVTYAVHTGKAFQITDDILGTFGDPDKSGKMPTDDLKEGKRTLLTVYALQHASEHDKEFLRAATGNQEMTDTDFEQCKDIIKRTGALEFARSAAIEHVEAAKKALDATSFAEKPTRFLRELAASLVDRTV